jgi:hypothetical protein
VDGDRLLLKVQFDMSDDFAADLDRKYREGYLDEWSVGFWPSEGKYAENDHGGLDFYEQRLDEVSAVNQGMNPNTATVSKAYHEYMDAASELRGIIDGYESRLREVEACVMRMTSELEAKMLADRLAEMTEAIKAGRTRV